MHHRVISIYTILSTYQLSVYPLVTLSFYLDAKAQSSKRRLPSPTHPPPLHRPEGRAWLRCHHLGEVMNSRAHCRMLPSAENTCPNHNWHIWHDFYGDGEYDNMMFCLVEHPTVWRTSLTSSVLEVPQLCIVHSRFLPLCVFDRKGFQFDKTKHIENNECVANHGHSEQNHGQSKNEVYTCFTVSPPKTIRHPRRCSNLCASLCLIKP